MRVNEFKIESNVIHKEDKVLYALLLSCCAGCRSAGEKPVESAAAPRMINIINFIRQRDYRVENADSLLYENGL